MPQNIVATMNLDCRLDSKTIALHARNAEYNPKVCGTFLLQRSSVHPFQQHFAAVITRICDSKTATVIFAPGNIVVTDAKLGDDSTRLASHGYACLIQKL